jgi:CheY-like chemotaxis protein
MTRVLLVDNEVDSLDALAFLVRDAGYSVETATSGAEAIVKIDRQPPDVLVTDLTMPSMSGTELARDVRSRAPRARIVLMTAYSVGEPPSMFDAVIRKPVDVAGLVRLLGRLAG